MGKTTELLLCVVDDFLAQAGWSETYFGKLATGNSRVVTNIRNRRDIRTETAEEILTFISFHKNSIDNGRYVPLKTHIQEECEKYLANAAETEALLAAPVSPDST